jgi:hypothetical protein
MNEIFEFLMRNVGLFIVIGGFVLTFLAKRRQSKGGGPGNNQGGKPNPMMPPFGGGVPRNRRQTSQSSSREAEERRGDEGNAYHPGEPRTEKASVQADRYTPPAADTSAVKATTVGSAVDTNDREMIVYENDAIRGMIWAEIMGAPRSKKPYRPRNR